MATLPPEAQPATSFPEHEAAITRLEAELKQAAQTAEQLRAEILVLRRRCQELEDAVAANAALEQDLQAARTDLNRLTSQMDRLDEHSGQTQARAHSLAQSFQEFYAEAVNPLTIASASAELLLHNEDLLGQERAALMEIHQNLEKVQRAFREAARRAADPHRGAGHTAGR